MVTPQPISFSQMEFYKLYKNINTFDDQWYMRTREGYLMTCSKMSNRTFNYSGASTTQKVFVPFDTKLTVR